MPKFRFYFPKENETPVVWEFRGLVTASSPDHAARLLRQTHGRRRLAISSSQVGAVKLQEFYLGARANDR